jgi:ATP-dependent RNA helicase DeaD
MTEEPGTRFQDLSLADPVLKTLAEVGYEVPTPIQAQTIPLMLAGRDVLGQAQTGTGKTAAFALPLLSKIDLSRRHVQVLVLAPTRELAIQVAEAFQRYAAHLPGFHVLPIYGGQAYDGQLRSLKRGVHVVVGTPGRVMDHMRRKTLRLGELSCLVLDEADEMLRMGFIDDVEWILEQTPAERQTALFSATMPAPIRRIANRYLRDPEHIAIKERTTIAATIDQYHWMVSGREHKINALTRILEAETFDGILIFVRTRTMTTELAEKLTARGYSCSALSGEMPQNRRERTVDQLKAGKLDILVATDVAARGLDIDRISHVINFDIPADAESYIHRIGRTGRAGRSGKTILFVAPRERRLLFTIEKATRQKIPLFELPSTEVINDQRITRFKQSLTDVLASEDLGIFRLVLEQYQQEHNVAALELAAGLARMVQGDEPLLLSADVDHRRRHEARPRQARPAESRPTTERPEPRSEPPRMMEAQKRPERAVEAPPRADRPSAAARTPRGPSQPSPGMERFRVEVGSADEIQPGNLVGAITGEADLTGSEIGRIEIFDNYSTIDLPSGRRSKLFEALRKVRVRGQRLRISSLEGDGASASASAAETVHRPRDFKPRDRKPYSGKSGKGKEKKDGHKDSRKKGGKSPDKSPDKSSGKSAEKKGDKSSSKKGFKMSKSVDGKPKRKKDRHRNRK